MNNDFKTCSLHGAYHTGCIDCQHDMEEEILILKADNARMREALQELYNLNLCPDYKTGASRENLFAEIAREALKGEG